MICQQCYQLEKFPSVYLKTDFKKVTLGEVVQKLKSQFRSWPKEELIQLVRQLKIVNCNVFDLKKFYPEKSLEELIYQILQIPFDHFKNFNQITTKNFEVIFKKTEREQESVFDPLNHNPLIEHISFLRLLLDDSPMKNDEVQNDNFAMHNNQLENGSGTKKFPLASLVEGLLSDHKDQIQQIKSRLQTHSKFLSGVMDQKIAKILQEVNYLQIQKLERLIQFMEEYEKSLYYQKFLNEVRENNLMVQEFLLYNN